MSLSDYAEASLLAHLINKTIWTPPATLYLALGRSISFSTDTTAAFLAVEAAYTGYARVAMTSADWSTPADISGTTQTTNINVVTFPARTAGSEILSSLALFDASTGGNALVIGTMYAQQIDADYTTPGFPIGALKLTMS